MPIGHVETIESKDIVSPLASLAKMKVLVGAQEGWDSHVMRVLEVEAGGFSPRHQHPWPHINYVLEGEGTLFLNGVENPIKAGSFAFIPSNELHQFQNTSKTTLKFICIVPTEGHK